MAHSTLGDVAEIVMGQSPPGDTCNVIGTGIPLLNGPTEYGSHHPCPVQYTTEARKLASPGDILFCVRGSTTGRMNWADREYAIGRGVAAIRHKTNTALQPLVRAVIDHGLPGLLAQATGSTFPNVSANQLAGVPWPALSLPQQETIAHILGTLDDKIELNRRTNETLEAMARALFKSWFVDFDPVRAKAEGRQPSGMDAETAKLFPSEFEESELGEIPKGWSALALYDLATYVNGAAYKAFQPNSDRRGLPIIKIVELKAGVTSQTKFSDAHMPEKYRLKTGDILFSWSGNPDTSIDTFVWSHGPAWLNQHIFRVEPHSADERSFVLATLKYLRPVFAEIARNKQTTGLGHVTAGDMQRLLVVKPDARALAAWNREAAPLFDAVFHNEMEALTLARLRDTLLPALLSGELSVSGAERVLEVQG
jgi:type I restriction enzyme S subunit